VAGSLAESVLAALAVWARQPGAESESPPPNGTGPTVACPRFKVVLGTSARKMLQALIGGQRDPGVLAELARPRMRPKILQLRLALEGGFDSHHALRLRLHLDHADRLSVAIDRLDALVDRGIRPFSERHRRLITIRRRPAHAPS
jgi:hypothetical protein